MSVGRVLSGVAPGPSLTEEVPALIQLDFDVAHPLALLVRELPLAMVALQAVLFGYQLVDLLGDLCVVHARLLPASVPIVTDATSVFLA